MTTKMISLKNFSKIPGFDLALAFPSCLLKTLTDYWADIVFGLEEIDEYISTTMNNQLYPENE